MRHLALATLAIFGIATAGCGSNLTGFAENILYPFESVDKKYPVPENPPEGVSQVYLDVKDHEGNTIKVHAYYRKAGDSARTLVYFHGNGENLQALNVSNFLGVMASLKVNYVIIDYPGLGRSEGVPNEHNLVNAGLEAFKFARKKFPRTLPYIWGRSLGAAVATQVMSKVQSQVNGFFLTSPWSSFIELAKDKTGLAKQLPEEWVAQHSYNTAEAAKGIHKRTLIHHGLADKLIPFKFGKKVFDNFPNGVATLKEFEGVGHNDIFQISEVWKDIKSY